MVVFVNEERTLALSVATYEENIDIKTEELKEDEDCFNVFLEDNYEVVELYKVFAEEKNGKAKILSDFADECYEKARDFYEEKYQELEVI